jgi:hypothetical protein
MSDNFSFTEGSGKKGAADDIDGVLYPRVKIAQGADGSATDVSSAAPLQVSLENHGANATAVKVDGSATTQPVSHDALTELAGAIDTEVQVDVVGPLPAGTNHIGDVDIASALPAGDNNIGNVDVVSLPALPAGTDLIGKTSAAPDTSTVYDGTTALTPKFAKISTSSSGASTVVSAVTGKKIRVLRLTLIANEAVNVKFQSHTTLTDLTGLHYLAANGGWVEPYCPPGIFETLSGEALDINLSAAVAVGGSLTYIEL